MEEGWLREVWQSLKKHWPRVFLFLGSWLVLGLGAYQLLFFVPDSGDESPRRLWAILAGVGLTGAGFHVYFKQKKDLRLLKVALQIVGGLDPFSFRNGEGGPQQATSRENRLDSFDPNRDIALGVALEYKGPEYRSRYDDQKRLVEILGQLDESEGLYRSIKYLDDLTLGNLEERIKRKFPRQVYFLRLNLLTHFRNAYLGERFLVYGEEQFADDEKILFEFCKKVMNQFYSNHKGYSIQPVEFDTRLLRRFFSEKEQEYRSAPKYSNGEDQYEEDE